VSVSRRTGRCCGRRPQRWFLGVHCRSAAAAALSVAFGDKIEEDVVTSADLFEIERALWNNDPVLYHDTLRPDALLLFPETGMITRDVAVAAIRALNRLHHYWTDVEFADQRVLSPMHDTRLLVYRATARWNYAESAETVLCSSIYALQSGEWKLILHQQTRVDAEPAAAPDSARTWAFRAM
jgi:hypothetical protein